MWSRWILVIAFITHMNCQDPVANLQQGRIVGVRVYTKNAVTPVEMFFGVPYAVPPIGRYRFSAPERHRGWRRTFFAHKLPPRCLQIGDNDNEHFSEDCLYLNIWTPRRADGNTLPVVVILYSETWSRGGVTTLPCQELAAEGVVVVTVAYRLHFLAFFTLKSIKARGNLALLDQYLALLWIRENIAAFGGDPASITLMGHSAGADSVLYHIASQRAIGLFQRAIVMSPIDLWLALDERASLKREMEVETASREMARVLGCITGSDEEVVECLRARPTTDIMRVYLNTTWSSSLGPVPDIFLPETEQYLSQSLASASKLSAVQLDLLMGNADLEAINTIDDDFNKVLAQSSTNILEYASKKAIPELLRKIALQNSNSEAQPVLVEAVNWEYLTPKSHGKAIEDRLYTGEGLARAQTAVHWSAGTALLAARLARRVSRLYAYRYTQPKGVDLRGTELNYTGAAHGTDLTTILGQAMLLQIARRTATNDEQRTSAIVRRYITNFIKFGTPASENEWSRYRPGEGHIHEITNQAAQCSASGGDRDIVFWLQYLPRLATFSISSGETGLLTANEQGEGRLRGGVFALSGLLLVLLLLLCACAFLLRWERTRRTTSIDVNDML